MAIELKERFRVDDGYLVLTIEPEAIGHNDVPVDILVEKLKAAQDLVFELASALFGRRGPGGSVRPEIKKECKLLFVKGEQHSPLQVLTRIEKIAPEVDKTPVGIPALLKVPVVLKAVQDQDELSLFAALPEPRDREKVLVAASALAPPEASGYRVRVGQADDAVVLAPEQRTFIERILAAPEAPPEEPKVGVLEPVTVTGLLEMINIKPEEQVIAVVSGTNSFPCTYITEHQALARRYPAGTMVEVKGYAVRDAHGVLKSVSNIFAMSEVLPAEETLAALEYKAYRFRFRYPLRVLFTPFETYVAFENQQLGIFAPGTSREDALEAFGRNFTSAWKEIAQASDDELSGDAQELKKILLDLVDEEASEA